MVSFKKALNFFALIIVVLLGVFTAIYGVVGGTFGAIAVGVLLIVQEVIISMYNLGWFKSNESENKNKDDDNLDDNEEVKRVRDFMKRLDAIK